MDEMAPLVDATVEEVLETMFFASAIEGSESVPVPEGPALVAAVSFTGPRNGTLAVRMAEPAAAALVGNFLADEDGVTEDLVGSVLGEMANVVCGSLLGRVDPEGHFAIAPPRLLDTAEGIGMWESSATRRSFEMEEGRIDIGLTLSV